MNTRPALIVFCGAVVSFGVAAPALFADAESPNLDTTTTTSTGGQVATTAVGGAFALPPGFTFLVDDTNRITVAVPAIWTDRSTAPSTVDGAFVPAIRASTDLDVWESSFGAPGLIYTAFPFVADPQPLLDRFDLSDGCTSTNVVPYTDGLFSGSWSQSKGCGPTAQSEWHVIVASPPDGAFTAAVGVQLTGPQDQQALDVALETFNVTAAATWPATDPATSSTAPTPTATRTTAPATTTPTPTTVGPASTTPAPTTTGLPSIGVRLVDVTNFLTVTVPADWTYQNLDFSRRDDGGERASIVASPDSDQYYGSWDSSGVWVQALPGTTEPADLLARYAYPRTCTDGGITPVDDGRVTGQRQTWTACDGLATRVVNVAARSLDNSYTIFVQVQQAAPDDAVLNQILVTVGAVPGAAYPDPAPAAPLIPTGPVPAELFTAPAVPLTAVADEDGRLSIAVPTSWTDTDVRPNMNDDASDRPRLAAAPVLDDFYSDWDAPGVQVVAYPFTNDPSTLLVNLGFADRCTDGGVQSYSNAGFTGLMQTWTNCANTASRDVLLAVSPDDQSVTVYIEVQLPDQDNTALQAVLSSLQVG